MKYLRDTISKETLNAAEIRRSTSVLRRLLIEDDLRKVASPRIGKVMITVPGVKKLVKATKKMHLNFFLLGGGNYGGTQIQGVSAQRGNPPEIIIKNYFSPNNTGQVNVDNFLKQPTICYKNYWFNRRDILKYVANVASGVHSGEAKTNTESLIARMRNSVNFNVQSKALHGTNLQIDFDDNILSEKDPPIEMKRGAIDCSLLEVISTTHFLVSSASIAALEQFIASEIN